ncbi:MAG: hypothetical protein C4534_07475 [Gaiellales bacterium]|nr:MAG: hypothetical protein C4534_07475 [Gaiellales bacterium]
MMKILLLLIMCLMLVIWVVACGEEEKATTDSQLDEPVTTETAEDDENADDPFASVENIEATVTVAVDGEVTVIWSQKDGSWRWEDPKDPESYVIFNKEEGKLWVVSDKVAMESDAAAGEETMYWGMGPAGILGLYAAMPGTATDDDTYEISVPGEGRVVLELKGPQGLPSRFVTYDASGNEEQSIVFEYSDVGDVPDDLFVLPSDVTIQAMPDIPDLPTDGSLPQLP